MSTTTDLIEHVDFVFVPTRDLEAAIEFYGTTLGLKMSVCVPDRGFAEFETGNLTLSVVDTAKMGLEHRASPNAVALRVADVERARGILRERGVTFNGDTLDTGVCHMAFFSDPDGNALMLHRRYAPRERQG